MEREDSSADFQKFTLIEASEVMLQVMCGSLLLLRVMLSEQIPALMRESRRSEGSSAGVYVCAYVNVLKEVNDDMWPLGLVIKHTGFSFLPPAHILKRKMYWEKLTHGNSLI